MQVVNFFEIKIYLYYWKALKAQISKVNLYYPFEDIH